MTQRYAPGLFDRLRNAPCDEFPDGFGWTLSQLKDAVARDLEALLNTRAGLPDFLLAPYPETGASVLNYGLMDFAGLCLSSDVDQKRICAAVQLAIERHEPRLHAVSAALRIHRGAINRIDFIICATLKADAAAEPVQFDAVLKQSTQQYSIHSSGVRRGGFA